MSVSLLTVSLLETVAAQLLLHGNAFVQILLDAEGEPAELFPLRPERVAVEADAAGWPAAYLYKAGEAKTRLAARDGLGRPSLVHLKAMHPLDDHYGLGCLGAAAGAVAIHNAATKWNKATMRRGLREPFCSTRVMAGRCRASSMTGCATRWRRGSRARPMPGGRCCWKAASNGRR